MPPIPKILLLLESARTCERNFARGIARYARLHGPWTFYRKPQFYFKTNRKGISPAQIKNLAPDGIIVSDTEDVEMILQLDKPTLIHTFQTDQYDRPVIIGDTQQTGKMGAEHLMGLGFVHFAYCGIGDYYWSRGRCASFQQTLARAGYSAACFELNPVRMKTALQKELSRLTQWLSGLPVPVGLMTCADDCSQYIVEACTLANLNIPEAIAVIGVDNDEMICELSDPPLSSVSLDFAAAGYQAAELLERIISGQSVPREPITVCPTHIEVRASTNILAIDDADVAKAVRFIRQHAWQSIQVADVLNEVACCRRRLHEKFVTIIGHSVHQEIRRVRIERISKLLRETDLTITQIALKMEFFNTNHLSRYYKHATGLNPLAYRKRFGVK